MEGIGEPLNSIEILRNYIAQFFQDAELSIDQPEDKENGTWILDIHWHGIHYVVEWFARVNKFGIMLDTHDTAYGEPPDRMVEGVVATYNQVREILRNAEKKAPAL